MERGDKNQAERSRYYLQTLERGLCVIKALGELEAGVTLSKAADQAGLPRAATRRVLLTLADLGYVSVEANLFRLTPRILELGTPVLSQMGLPEVADSHLRDLASATGEAVSLAVLDRGDSLTVAHIPTIEDHGRSSSRSGRDFRRTVPRPDGCSLAA